MTHTAGHNQPTPTIQHTSHLLHVPTPGAVHHDVYRMPQIGSLLGLTHAVVPPPCVRESMPRGQGQRVDAAYRPKAARERRRWRAAQPKTRPPLPLLRFPRAAPNSPLPRRSVPATKWRLPRCTSRRLVSTYYSRGRMSRWSGAGEGSSEAFTYPPSLPRCCSEDGLPRAPLPGRLRYGWRAREVCGCQGASEYEYILLLHPVKCTYPHFCYRVSV